jgi:hypothetical protein
MDRDYKSEFKVICSNYNKKLSWNEFQFNTEDESLVESNYSLPLKYIYEPNAAILKAGAFKSFGHHYKLKKLEVNSHLYTSDKLIEYLPGRAFELIDILTYNKKIIKTAIPPGKANVATRNFPDSVESIRKKTGLKPGGKDYLFATTLMNGKKVLLLTKKTG